MDQQPGHTPSHTHGTLLDGRIQYAQHRKGYRTGIEPVLLAAGIPAHPGDHVLEAGCGAGAALLCLLWRVPGLTATGIELNPATAALARQNLQANNRTATIQTTDVTTAALPPIHNHVLANPPWHSPASTVPPGTRRALATHGTGLPRWIAALTAAVAPGGTLTLILPDAQSPHAAALMAIHLPHVTILPFAPKPGRPPKLTLLQARHGPPAIARLPPRTLHAPNGRYTPELDAILRDGAPIPFT